MPGLDGTGPRGMGPMTGGMRGWCAPGGTGRPAGCGGGFARRGGRGNRRMTSPPAFPAGCASADAGAPVTEAAPVDELSALRAQADALQQRLSAIQARIAEIEKAE